MRTYTPTTSIVLLALLPLCIFTQTITAADKPTTYKHGRDSIQQANVPRGKLTMHTFNSSKVFASTIRRYWIYVPDQYKGDKPAALMVFQDGHAYTKQGGDFRVPTVFDNLIHKGDMPVTIGVFIDPGHKSDKLQGPKPGWNPRPSNRAFEYDSVTKDYATFLIDELLPSIEKNHKLSLSKDPKHRAICGISSGGICAWTVAWFRSDSFSKVLSHIGSFTNIRGGHVYPALIRKTEKKPIRIYLQDGKNDLDNAHGNWYLSNLQMAAALRFSKYDYKFVEGDGGHNGKHGGAILPDSLRWLWREPK
jgi:enterochelin esterase-like enzyme